MTDKLKRYRVYLKISYTIDVDAQNMHKAETTALDLAQWDSDLWDEMEIDDVEYLGPSEHTNV